MILLPWIVFFIALAVMMYQGEKAKRQAGQRFMKDRSDRISRLLNSQKSRAAYIWAKLGVLVPAQIRALRIKSTNPPMPFQRDLARESEMHQSRISMFETPGLANVTLETLSKIAAALRVGLIVEFVPFSDMLQWENAFSPDFNVVRLEQDKAFLEPAAASQPWPLNNMGILGGSGDESKGSIEYQRDVGNGGNSAAVAKKPMETKFDMSGND